MVLRYLHIEEIPMNDVLQLYMLRLLETLEKYADIIQAVARMARARGTFPSNNALETQLWPSYRSRIPRDTFRYLCDDVRAMIGVLPVGPMIVNKQIVTPELIREIILVATLVDVALKRGPDVAREIMERLKSSNTKRILLAVADIEIAVFHKQELMGVVYPIKDGWACHPVPLDEKQPDSVPLEEKQPELFSTADSAINWLTTGQPDWWEELKKL
jgi:hypothetical protein